MTSTDANVALVRRFIEEYQVGGDEQTFAALVHPEFVDHTRPPGISEGPAGIREQFDSFRGVLAGFSVRIVIQVAQDDLVSTFKIFSGSHVGAFLGLPATGRQLELPVSDTIRIRDGRIAEHWGVLGLAPLLLATAAQ